MTTRTVDFGLLLIRVALGTIMVAHGAQKLFTFGYGGVAGSMAQMGIPFPQIGAALLMATEFGGGLLILAGLLTRFAAAAFAFAMFVAATQVHLPNGFFLPNGYEFTLMLGLTSIGLVLTGAGRYSLDALIGRARHVPATEALETQTPHVPRRVA